MDRSNTCIYGICEKILNLIGIRQGLKLKNWGDFCLFPHKSIF